MNLPGFTAEQTLKQRQARYSQRSTAHPIEATGEVRPQLPPFLRVGVGLFSAANLNRCCLDGNLGCCRAAGELLAHSLTGH